MSVAAIASRPRHRLRSGKLERARPLVALSSAGLGVLFIVLLHYTLDDAAATLLLDRDGLTYPYSIQNGMWVMFFVALGELAIRTLMARLEGKQISSNYLPEDKLTVLQAQDLPAIYRRVSEQADNACFLPRLIERCVLQFQSSRSFDQSALLLNTRLVMLLQEVDLRYGMLRYITWLIPSLGFIGTVMGIGYALSYAGEPGRFEDPTLLTELTSRLALAFDTTFLALILSAIILFIQNIVQSREEYALNRAGQYCLDNLVNRLYVA
jgi:biopolymer transport protein ExbB/TolQ